jgi:hypothetical protein
MTLPPLLLTRKPDSLPAGQELFFGGEVGRLVDCGQGVVGIIYYKLLFLYNNATLFLTAKIHPYRLKITTQKGKVLHLNFLRGNFFNCTGPISG